LEIYTYCSRFAFCFVSPHNKAKKKGPLAQMIAGGLLL
jgi:hypothetical protein